MKKISFSVQSFADIQTLPIHATFHALNGYFCKATLKKEKTSSWDLYTDNEENLEQLQEWLFAYFHKMPLPALPIELKCSSFAHEVFKILSAIPAGSTLSYKDIGQALGTRAFRAVGQALGSNPLPFLIPCHRVVREDGSLGGFRDGVEVKKELLSLEYQLFSLNN